MEQQKFLAYVGVLFLFLVVWHSNSLAQADWPQFRGADSRGIAYGDALPDQWSTAENISWKTNIPGRGWSSPIVWGDKVFLTTVINSGTSEEPKKGLYFGGNRPAPADTLHEWKVYCLNLKTGKIIWEQVVHESLPDTPIHLKNSYASETPVTDGERVYFYFGNIGLFVFDLDGKLEWSKSFAPLPIRNGWGTAASPILHGNRLYVLNDNNEDSWLKAINKTSGKEIWTIHRDEKSNWSSPYIWENELRTEIIIPGTGIVTSYDLDGNELWSLEGMSSITIATPYSADGLLYISSGYVGSRQKPIYAIRPGAKGDISINETTTSNDYIVWCSWRAAPYNPTTLLYQDNLYVLLDRGMLSCLDPKSGEFHFEKEKIPRGRSGFTASPWAYDGKVFCLNEDGATFVFRAGKSFDLLHVNRLPEDDIYMATPAIASNRLLIRSSTGLYCFQSDGASAN
ncbi:MAG: PQQ-binding-like beta-propeller repeat protein [Verrucomicrobia bacterium]|nr:PQQ-binding-like beta-propeller repeat protein [Verrucomicrobiota bacterium]